MSPYSTPPSATTTASAPPPPPTPSSPRAPSGRRRIWLPVTTAATGAALAASLLTANFTGAFSTAEPEVSQVETADTAHINYTDSASVNWQNVAERVRPTVVAITTQSRGGGGQGSGVIIDDEGHIVTNDHVVAGAEELRVTLSDGRILPATVVGADPTTDLAVIGLEEPPKDLVSAKFAASHGAQVGDPVMAVGNPLGLDSTVTTGIISALDRPVSTMKENTDPFTSPDPVIINAIQIDAAINPGNSGGPLFNAAGRVIGINSSIAALAGGSSGNIGLGFAIPADVATNVSDQLLSDGEVAHPLLGVTLSSTTVAVSGTERLGAQVEEVSPDSAAAQVGIKSGDVITAFDGKSVNGAESLTGFVRGQAVGTEVTLTIVRDGNAQDITVALQTQKSEI